MSTTLTAAPTLMAATAAKSNLTKQLEHSDEDGLLTPKANKTRSLSDNPLRPALSPSPAIRESPRRVTKDDSATYTNPTTPRRPSGHLRGLSLQMPLKEGQDAVSPSISRNSVVPLSPKLEASSVYSSPGSVLPRRSRGLDFARASTNLHQTILAESSPDASPITGRGINIPQRRVLGQNSVLDSPSQHAWMAPGERTTLSSSVSSINMMDSDTDSDDSSEDMALDREMDDPMLNTPAAARINALVANSSPGMDWLNNANPTNSQMSLLNFQPHRMSFRRARLKNNKSNHSSSSVSMRSSKPSPGPLSPPMRPTVEGSSYFGLTRQQVKSRRESLSLGTDDLQLSDSEWDADHKMDASNNPNEQPTERGVIRRAVTRRSNLLPKTKGFARIRAALMEESDPLHTEARREAEVIKQVQESDEYNTKSESILGVSTTAEPIETSIEESLSNADFSLNTSQDSETPEPQPQEPFSTHAKRHSGGLGFWNNFEHTPPNIDRYRTPPPLNPRDSTESDANMSITPSHSESTSNNNSNNVHTGSLIRRMHRSRSRSTTPLASAQQNTNNPPTAGDVARKVNNKRRRDDDFDPASFKRRAVSPGMMGSAQSSPVVPQSPTLNSDKAWGRPPPKTNTDRSNSNGSTSANGGGPKRVGLQVMNDANDGFMSMSID